MLNRNSKMLSRRLRVMTSSTTCSKKGVNGFKNKKPRQTVRYQLTLLSSTSEIILKRLFHLKKKKLRRLKETIRARKAKKKRRRRARKVKKVKMMVTISRSPRSDPPKSSSSSINSTPTTIWIGLTVMRPKTLTKAMIETWPLLLYALKLKRRRPCSLMLWSNKNLQIWWCLLSKSKRKRRRARKRRERKRRRRVSNSQVLSTSAIATRTIFSSSWFSTIL